MRRLVGVLAVAALALAACGGDGGEGDGEDCVDFTGKTISITMKDNSFDPTCATGERSQPLKLVNGGAINHTFTIEGTPVDIEVPPGQTMDLDPIDDGIEAGTYTVYCKFHGTPDGTGMAMELTAT